MEKFGQSLARNCVFGKYFIKNMVIQIVSNDKNVSGGYSGNIEY
jgi:hypothetical protein